MSELKEIIKKIGFTDKYLVITSIVIGVFCFCCLGVFAFLGRDTIAFMISAVGLLATVVGFIVNKNAKENVAKISSWGNPNTTANVTVTMGELKDKEDLTDNTAIQEGDNQ